MLLDRDKYATSRQQVGYFLATSKLLSQPPAELFTNKKIGTPKKVKINYGNN